MRSCGGCLGDQRKDALDTLAKPSITGDTGRNG